MTDLISSILQWLNSHPEYSWIITFVISASESIAIIGTIVPGSITMTALGTLAGAGIIPFNFITERTHGRKHYYRHLCIFRADYFA